ncbi:phage tail tape measure protein [Lysobacter sp. TAF61]|uniref:phage tail tape measure protein n=1 Tax=Lysobacter sp. TAF61 TaxID=3233072 RepID=UPI003F990689
MADLKLQVILSAIDRATAPLRKITTGSSSTAQALKAARLQLRDLDRTQNQVQGFRRLSAQAGESGLAMKAAHQKAAQLRAEMAGVDAPTQKAARALAKAEREAVKLKNAHLGNLRALKESKGELASAGIAINRLSEHERHLRAEISRTTQVMGKQQIKLDQLARKNQQLYLARRQLAKSQGMAGAAASGGATLGAAGAVLGAPVLASVKAYASFQDAMTGVARQVQGARDGTGQLTPLYFQLGDSIKAMAERIPMATTEIAALVEAGARMGIQGKENLLAFAETTAITAAAFDLPVDEVGENMGKLAGLYKIPIKNISQLGDVINFLDDNALSKGGDIIDVMQRLGGVADKLDFRKAAALGSTFLSLGAAPEVAASASNAMVRELSIATIQSKRFRKGLETLGLDARKLQDRMAFDSTGTIISVLEQIKKLDPADQITAATQLFGKEYGDDAAKLANNLGEYRKQLALVDNAQAKGSMQREAAARLANLSAGWTLLKSTAFNAAADMGATLAPSLLELMSSVRSVLGQVRTWIKENPQLAGTILKATAAIAGLLTVLGGLALGIAGVIGPLALVKFSASTLGISLQPVLSTISSLGSRALPMLANGARALLPIIGGVSAPVLAIVAAVAVAGVLIWKYWQPIKAFMVGLWQGISEAAAPIGAQLAAAFAPLRPVFAWLGNVLGQVWGWIKQFLTPFQATSAELQNATNYGRAFGQMLGTVILAPLRLVIGAVSLLWRAMQLAFSWSPIGMLVQNWGAIIGFLSSLMERFRAIGGQLMQGLIGGLLGGLKAVRDTITGVGGQVVTWFKQKLGIHSPSRVFAQLGDYTMAGLAGGLDRSRGLPIRALSAVAGNMRQVGAGIALGAAAAPAVAIDHRPPLAPPSSATTAPGAIYNITINAAPGAAAQDIAQLVRAEIERIERERQARTRSRLGDYGN